MTNENEWRRSMRFGSGEQRERVAATYGGMRPRGGVRLAVEVASIGLDQLGEQTNVHWPLELDENRKFFY